MSHVSSANESVLMSLKKNLAQENKVKSQPEYAPVNEGDTYKTARYKTTEYVIVHEVKAKKIKLKRSPDAQDSFTISRAEFEKYYTKYSQ